MDQVTVATSTDKSRAVSRLRDFIASSIDSARRVEQPFYHLQLDRVFPEDVYASMLAAMPVAADYRPLRGRNQCNVLPDGTPTRVKIDLFPEYIRHLPPDKRTIWDVVSRIDGTDLKDRWVVLGNHRDAWVFGAVDPNSGTASMLEVGRGLGQLLKQGWNHAARSFCAVGMRRSMA